MLQGLVAYDDDSDEEEKASSPSKSNGHANVRSFTVLPAAHFPLCWLLSNVGSLLPFIFQESQVIIRRPVAQHKSHPRAVIADEVLQAPSKKVEASPSTSVTGSENAVASSSSLPDPEDEMTRIRALLKPAPIPGVEDWGIPPPSTEPCDPALQTKLAQFHDLKRGNPPKHFNDSLMGSRAFRNPHLYAKLVEFVDVDERTTNFPPALWDPSAVDVSCMFIRASLTRLSAPLPASLPCCHDAARAPHYTLSAPAFRPPYAVHITDISTHPHAHPQHTVPLKAEQQKTRAEQQSASQAAGKRSQIAFTSSTSASTSTSSSKTRPKEKERDRDRSKRFEPYGSGGGGGHRERERSRWG
ncbi:HCNGP-like protein-domain-containing protein [Mycena sanguinolenta]|nr:HCNGP-like protein-domain-containing protein [Mycena sanguinolenta]